MPDSTRKLATIVALDVAGYSARTERDEAKAAAEVAALREVIAAIGSRRGGRVFNTAGDGFMLEFGSSLAAVEAALELAETCEPKVRVGVHLGDVVVQPNGDLLGHGVNVAARLMARSAPGSALISADVRRTIRGPLGVAFEPRGAVKLDKMIETVEAFALSRPGDLSSTERSVGSLGARHGGWIGPLLSVGGLLIAAALLTAPARNEQGASDLSAAPVPTPGELHSLGPNCHYWGTDFVVVAFIAQKHATRVDDTADRLTTRMEAALNSYAGMNVFTVPDMAGLKSHVPLESKDRKGNAFKHLACSIEGNFIYTECNGLSDQLSITIRMLTAQRQVSYSRQWCGPPDQIVDAAVTEAAREIARIASLTTFAAR